MGLLRRSNNVTLDQFLAFTPEQLTEAFDSQTLKPDATYDFIFDSFKIQNATLYIILLLVSLEDIPNTQFPQHIKIPVLRRKNINANVVSKNNINILIAAALSGDVRNILALLPDELVSEERIIAEMKSLLVATRNNPLTSSIRKSAFSALAALDFIPQYSYELLKFYFSQDKNSKHFIEFDLSHVFVAFLRSMQPDKSTDEAEDCSFLLSVLNHLHKRNFASSLKMLDLLHDIYNSSANRERAAGTSEVELTFFQRLTDIGTDPFCLMLAAEACTRGLAEARLEFTRFQIYQKAYESSADQEGLVACRRLALYRMETILSENPNEGLLLQRGSSLFMQAATSTQSFKNFCNLAQLYLTENRKREALASYERAFPYAFSDELKENLINYLLEMRAKITPSVLLWLDIQLLLINLYLIYDNSQIESVFNEIINQAENNSDFHDKIINYLQNTISTQNEGIKNFWFEQINIIIGVLITDFINETSLEIKNSKFIFINRLLQILFVNNDFNNSITYAVNLYGHTAEINTILSEQYIHHIKQQYIDNIGSDFENTCLWQISNLIDGLFRQLEDESFTGNKTNVAELILSLSDFFYQQNLYDLCYNTLCTLYLKLHNYTNKVERNELQNDVIGILLRNRLVEHFPLFIPAYAGHHFYQHSNFEGANQQFNTLIVKMSELSNFECGPSIVADLCEIKDVKAYQPAWITLIKYYIASNNLMKACCLVHDVLSNNNLTDIHNDAMTTLNTTAQLNFLPAIILLIKYKKSLSQDITEAKNLLSLNPFSEISAYLTMPESYLAVLTESFYAIGLDLMNENETEIAKKCLDAAGVLGHGEASLDLANILFEENQIADCLNALELAINAKISPQGIMASNLLKAIMKKDNLDLTCLPRLFNLLALAVYQQIEINYQNVEEAHWSVLQSPIYYLIAAKHEAANYLMMIVHCHLYNDPILAIELFFNRLAPMHGPERKINFTHARARYHESKNEVDEAVKHFRLFLQEAEIPTCSFFFPERVSKSREHAKEVIHRNGNTL